MIAFVLALLAPLAQGGPAGGGASVLRAYDLAAAAPRASEADQGGRLAPFLIRSGNEAELPEEGDPRGDVDFVYSALQLLFPQEFEYESRGAWLGEDGRLWIRGPAALHDKVKRALQFLEETTGAASEYQIDVLALDDAAAALPSSALVSLAEAQKLVEQSQGAGRAASHRLRVRPGLPAVLDVSKEVQLVVDYDAEIAQGSFVHDPVVSSFALGTRVVMRAAPARGGSFLALLVRQVLPLGAVRERQIELAADLNTDKLRDHARTPAVFQSQDVVHRSFALGVMLPDDRALVLVSELALARARGREAVVVRRLPGGAAALAQLDLGTPRERITLVQRESFLPPVCNVNAAPDVDPEDGLLRVKIGPGNASGVEELLGGDDRQERFESWPWIGFVPRREAEAGASPVPEAIPVDARAVEIALELRRAQEGPALARCRLPVRTGQGGAVVLSLEGFVVSDADVEVAQFASIVDPRVGVEFEGLAVAFLPRLREGGGLALDLTVQARVREGEPELRKLDKGGALTVELGRHEQLLASERLLFPTSGARATVGAKGKGLSLEVEVRF